MMEYIKKLRACIKWLLEREDANLIEIGNISARLEVEGKEHSETGTKPELDPIIESDFLAQVQPNTWSGRVMLGKARFFLQFLDLKELVPGPNFIEDCKFQPECCPRIGQCHTRF